MTTFSQLIDDVIFETLRPEQTQYAGPYLNQVIREMHHKSGQSNEMMPVFYGDNRQEDLVTLSGMDSSLDSKYLWDIPSMPIFQAMEAVYYKGYGRYALERDPRTALRFNVNEISARFYYYRTGPQIAFMNPGSNGQFVFLSWFEYPKALAYYPKDTSPMLYDELTGLYTENPKYTGPLVTVDSKMQASTNWLLQRHTETLRQGMRSKIWNRIDDGQTQRTKNNYAQFETMKISVQNTEGIKRDVNYGN